MKNNQLQNEETLLNETTIANVAQKNNSKNADSKKGRKILWQDVLVGGVPGIVIGAAGVMVATSFKSESAHNSDSAENGNNTADSETENVTVTSALVHETAPLAMSVNDQMSFNEAYAAARAEVGPGGVFMWHGNAYSTYSHDEWASMTPEQKADYSASLTSAMSHQVESHTEEDHHESNDIHPTDFESDHSVTSEPSGDVDIRVQEVGFVETPDGDEAFVAVAQVEGHDALFIDQDIDGIVDYLLVDINDDNDLQEQEILEISEAGLTDVELVTANTLDTTMPDDDLYAMGPDYTNDADIDSLA